MLQKILDLISGLLRAYPALSGGVVNVIALLVERFGLHVSAGTLTALASVLAVITAAVVHQNVSPVKGAHEKAAGAA